MLGFHTNLSNISRDYNLVKCFGFHSPCMQLFASGPQSRKAIFDNEKENWLIQSGIQVVLHGSYVNNPWGCSNVVLNALSEEMRLAQRLNCQGLIVHASKKMYSDKALRNVLLTIDANIQQNNSRLWIETHCAKPCRESLETPEKITTLWERIEDLHLSRLSVGICLDTAHIHSSGVTLDGREKTEQWLGKLPKQATFMLHLNDSNRECGSGKDEHAKLFTGRIWGDYLQCCQDSGVVALLQWCEKRQYTVILERGVFWNEQGQYLPFVGAAQDLINIRTMKLANLL